MGAARGARPVMMMATDEYNRTDTLNRYLAERIQAELSGANVCARINQVWCSLAAAETVTTRKAPLSCAGPLSSTLWTPGCSVRRTSGRQARDGSALGDSV